MRQVIVGTAGHIDHGKTSLVRKLTGTDTDRLAEEQRRGISIELGFASLMLGDCRVGFVDVPGHERFIRNMVAGVSGIDLALLVVAADDGIMPQTREHLDILDLLDVRSGIVVVTKTDLVTESQVESVCFAVEELLATSSLAGAAIVRVSSVTETGLDQLTAALAESIRGLPRPESRTWFRMAIDRVLQLEGQGTIVAGSPMHGSVVPGDQLQLLPENRTLVVRDVEQHGESSPAGFTGRQRTAINLRGVSRHELRRGQQLVTPGRLGSSSRLLSRVHQIYGQEQPIRNRGEYRLHIGTQEVVVTVVHRLPQIASVADHFSCELRSRDPIVARWGDRFILRELSPARTIGGGVIIDPAVPDDRRAREMSSDAILAQSGLATERLAGLYLRSDRVTETDAIWRAGLEPDSIVSIEQQLVESGDLLALPDHSGTERLAHPKRLKQRCDTLLKLLDEAIASAAPVTSLKESIVDGLWRNVVDPDLLARLKSDLIARGQLIRSSGHLRLAGQGSSLSPRQIKQRDQLLQLIEPAGISPPKLQELCASTGLVESIATELLRTAVDERIVVPISDELWLSLSAVEDVRHALIELFHQQESATLSDMRVEWGVTRKWAVPLAEWCDREGWTVREENVRRAGPNLKSE